MLMVIEEEVVFSIHTDYVLLMGVENPVTKGCVDIVLVINNQH